MGGVLVYNTMGSSPDFHRRQLLDTHSRTQILSNDLEEVSAKIAISRNFSAKVEKDVSLVYISRAPCAGIRFPSHLIPIRYFMIGKKSDFSVRL